MLKLIRIKHVTVLAQPKHAIDPRKVSAANAAMLKMLALAQPPQLLHGDHPRRAGSDISSPRYNPEYKDGFLLLSDDEDERLDASKKSGGSDGSDEAQREINQSKADQTRMLMMQVLNGIPDSTLVPPETVLFVCKLNPVTTSGGLQLCFSRFGVVKSAEVIRDKKTEASLRYAFVEFETVESCNNAYQKMDNALVDDSRIHVDFSQSVAKAWAESRKRGRQ